MRPIAEQEFTTILPTKYLDLTDALRATTQEILEHTIHMARWSEFMPNGGMKKFARALAKDLKRPYVPYFKWHHHTLGYKGMSVEIPNKQFLSPIVAPLLLVSKTAPNVYVSRRFEDDQPIISHAEIKAYTTFYFRGSEGTEIFNNWLSRCREDTDMRRALKLPCQ